MQIGQDERKTVLQSVKNLYQYRVAATDGLAGGAVDFYFNDQDWSTRHTLISQHPTRLHKAVLLSPSSVTRIDNDESLIHVSLSRAECDALPSANTVLPVCRQYLLRAASPTRSFASADPHLRSAIAVTGYEINNGEQHLGVIHDFLLDTRTWTVAFLVGRRFGMQEREFLVSTSAVSQISFASRRVAISKFSHWDLVFEARNGYDRLLDAQAA
ncbi:MAG TPA: hypothetical protein VM680_16695 [Verrucomicrobiae bacterium]|nr:hypothetical protein [Verrucomicrobiae bacterium]